MDYLKIKQNVKKLYGIDVEVTTDDRSIFLSGNADDWQTVVDIGKMFVDAKSGKHVVNDIKLNGYTEKAEFEPKISDKTLDGKEYDVVIIGGGISGTSVARELSRYQLKTLLVEKHSDVAHGASGANDGMVHAGIDLKHQCKKLHYVVPGNARYEEICNELGVDFKREGQYVVFASKIIKLLAHTYLIRAKKHNIHGVKIISKKQIDNIEPQVSSYSVGAMYIPSTGAVSPYKLTIAYAENAVQNGVEISLDTIVKSMQVESGKVTKVVTNRGTVSAKVVVNAAGVFADKVAEMAGDRYFSIHPRRGTDLLMDKNGDVPSHAISLGPTLATLGANKNTKGGGIIKTVDGNILLGPDAVEVPDREDTSTCQTSVDNVFTKQQKCCPNMKKNDIIAYFSGVRASTYEEDFIIECSTKVNNLVHVAGIQSPGLTAAPAFSIDVAKLVVDNLKAQGIAVEENKNFNPIRKKPVVTATMNDLARTKLIKQNPDYGKIICRCEEISLGEINDAINNPLGVATVDSVKRRTRAGMGRCQGGFCMPLVVKAIAEQKGIAYEDVRKGDGESLIAFGQNKNLEK